MKELLSSIWPIVVILVSLLMVLIFSEPDSKPTNKVEDHKPQKARAKKKVNGSN